MSISLYVHFPFCTNKCHYCDFYKEVHDKPTEAKFYQFLAVELELAIEKISDRTISTIFIGGGTPSLTNLDLFEKFIQQVKQNFTLAPNLEFSLECNPESINLEVLSRLKEIGVTRPTYGLQSFNEKTLKVLGRDHNVHQSQQAIYFTNALGYKTYGVDLIFGVPNQSSKMFSYDVEQLIDLDPPHISFYQLIFEKNTELYERYLNKQIFPLNDDLILAMYKSGCEKFKNAGYVRYEICSFAKPYHECRHNISYWDGSDYLGLGSSAHSFIDNVRFYNSSSLSDYFTALNKRELPRKIDESGIEERIAEAIMLGLRTEWGVNKKKFFKRFEKDVLKYLDENQVERLQQSGHLIVDDEKIKLTDEGFFVIDEVIRLLVK
ncbi:MAG TPA: radical SAM family heme chaperone HemW [candidate division Zixibacteria bacterium]|nr:radical SAM family heme chaperone HemW [candidate division Zixibacteria bacterium]